MSDSNLSRLADVQPLDLNISTMFNDTTEIPLTIFETVKDSVGDVWFYSAILGIFLIFNFLFYRKEENFGYDISRSLLISSGFSLIISTGALLSEWVSTIYPIIWFGSLTFIAYLMVYNLKKKNM